MKTALRLLVASGLLGPAAAPAEALHIVSPTAGTVVSAGASMLVRVVADPGEQLTDVAVGIGDGSVIANPTGTPGTFEATVVVPISGVGPDFVVAVGSTPTGRHPLDFVQISVDPGLLRSVTVDAPPRLSRIGQVFRVVVQGTFADSVTRDLTLSERGTTYSTSNDTVLGVHPNGLIQARTRGAAELTVTNRGRTSTTVVFVTVPDPPDNQIPVPDPGLDQTVASESLVTLSAAASRDPDGHPLRYRWQQESGRIVTLFATNAVELRFRAPRVTAPQELTFSLVVSDDKGATSFPAVVRVTVQP